jgi:folate-binding protein YgfZ
MQIENTITDLSHLGLLKITGKDAKKFLQGQLTCNLEEVTPTQARLGAHCNPQGRIISLFQLFLHQENYYLQMPRNMLPIAQAALKKYAVFFKVELSDASEELMRLGYCGQQIETPRPEKEFEAIESTDVLTIKFPGTPSRYELLGSPDLLKSRFSITPGNVWQYLNIANGIPSIYPETSEKFLPHEINLPNLNGVSFNKGCYTGQEIIARMQYRGKLKTRLFRAKAEKPPLLERGGNIYSEQKISGTIVDYCQLEYNNYELLLITSEENANRILSLDEEQQVKLEIFHNE